jgi:hypothetical protein
MYSQRLIEVKFRLLEDLIYVLKRRLNVFEQNVGLSEAVTKHGSVTELLENNKKQVFLEFIILFFLFLLPLCAVICLCWHALAGKGVGDAAEDRGALRRLPFVEPLSARVS